MKCSRLVFINTADALTCCFCLLFLALVGCAPIATTLIGSATPIKVDNADTIAVANITLAMDLDEKIGRHHTGLLSLPAEPYHASKVAEGYPLYKSAVAQELREAGFQVPKSSFEESVFGEESEESKKTNFLIGGTIINCKFNSYSSVGGTKSTAEVTVKWEVLDRTKNVVVYSKETKGQAQGPGQNVNTVSFAIRGSVREVLADQEFIETVRR